MYGSSLNGPFPPRHTTRVGRGVERSEENTVGQTVGDGVCESHRKGQTGETKGVLVLGGAGVAAGVLSDLVLGPSAAVSPTAFV